MKRFFIILLTAALLLGAYGCANCNSPQVPADTEEQTEQEKTNDGLAFDTAVDALLNRKAGTYEMSLSYELKSDDSLETSSSYSAVIKQQGSDESIDMTTYLYGLPMEESNLYVDGVYYQIPFGGSSIRSAVSAEDYQSLRAGKLFLRFLSSDCYTLTAKKADNGTEFEISDVSKTFDRYLHECLSLKPDMALDLSKTKITASAVGDRLNSFGLTAEGKYRLCGADKTFTVTYNITNVTDEKNEIKAPTDLSDFYDIGSIQLAPRLNDAYRQLAAFCNFGVKTETVFTLSYDTVEMKYTETAEYEQTTGDEGFRFNKKINAKMEQGADVYPSEYVVTYEDGKLVKTVDGSPAGKESNLSDLDMYYDAAEYYNAQAVTYEAMEDVKTSLVDGGVQYRYQYLEEDVNSLINSYINMLYNNADGFIDGSDGTEYVKREGTTTVSDNFHELSEQTITFDVVYHVSGTDLHCTLSVTVTPEIK